MRAGWSRRSSWLGVVVTVGLVMASSCSGGQPEQTDQVEFETSDTIAPPSSSPAAADAAEPVIAESDDGVSDAVIDARPSVLDDVADEPLGDVEVALVQRLPRLELSWTTAELDVPAGAMPTMWLGHVGVVGDELIAVATSTPEHVRQDVLVWRSRDGTSWHRSDQRLATGEWVHATLTIGEQLLALGQRQHADGSELLLLRFGDDGTWEPIDLPAAGIDPSGMNVWMHTSGERGAVLVAERYEPMPSPPLLIETDEFRLVLDESSGTFELMRTSSGELVTSGPMDGIYGWNEDGQPIWRLDTGELLTIVPWDVWETVWAGSWSPLPIPVPTADADSGEVDWDGYRIVMDDAALRVEVSDVTTGEIITTATYDEFFRGPSPQFRDDASGEVVWSPTWQEWDDLMTIAYTEHTVPPEVAGPEQMLLVTNDGIEWTEVAFDVPGDMFVESLWTTDDGFGLVTVDHTSSEPTRTLHRSADGLDWSTSPIEDRQDMMSIMSVASGAAGAITVTSTMGYGAPVLTTSPDGVTWTPAFQLAEQDDGRTAWFGAVASGPSARAAIATLSGDGVPEEPLTISIGGRTVRFGIGWGDELPAFAITDDATSATLLEADWHSLELAVQGERDPIVTHADGVSTFWAADGTVVMEIPDDAVFSAFEAQHVASSELVEHVLFLERNGTWYEVPLPIRGHASAHALAIGDRHVLVGVVDWSVPEHDAAGAVHVLVAEIAEPTG